MMITCKSKRWGILSVVVSLMLLISCKKLVEIPPPDTEIVRESVFEDDNTALASLLGIYNKLVTSTGFSGGSLSISVAEGLYADELTSYAAVGHPIFPYYINNVGPANSSVASLWSSSYNIIYSANAVVEGVKGSNTISAEIKKQFTGEALFIRAFTHFYLVNLFGDVPYITTTDYRANTVVSRLPVKQVYDKIIEDLIVAKGLLTNDYPSANRVRVNKGTAASLLARVYLYSNDWINAEAQATEVINNSQYSLITDLNSVFLKESKEVIWQLIPPYGYTNEGSVFILVAAPTVVALKNDLVDSFQPGDLRKQIWTNSVTSASGLSKWFFAFKYKVKNINNNLEYSVVLRLAEQYLIRAEARAERNKLSESAQDINVVRRRAGLNDTTVAGRSELLAIIERERKSELFTEWGHRFFDLKRWGKLNSVLVPIKPNWKTTSALLPIPLSELLANPRLKQNPGY